MSSEATRPTRKVAESGVLRFDGALITYTSQYESSFSVPLSEIAVIGEWTNQDGPGLDDWFLVFVPRRGDHWFEASMYAEGIEAFREQFAAVLGVSICGSLNASADFASRILWPAALAGLPLFTFSPVTGSGFIRRMKLSVLPEISHSLSPDTLSAIERNGA